jgi:hypothetical protein
MGKARFSGTGTSERQRSGTATVIRFRMNAGHTVVGLERENGQRVLLACEPELANKLLTDFGYQRDASFISVEPLIGLKVAYRESGTGMLLEMKPMHN